MTFLSKQELKIILETNNMDIDILSTDFHNKYLIILKEKNKNKIFYCWELMKDVISCYRDGMDVSSITNFVNSTYNCSYDENEVKSSIENIKNSNAIRFSFFRPLVNFFNTQKFPYVKELQFLTNTYIYYITLCILLVIILQLYSILEEHIYTNPTQWECWSYIHKWFERDFLFPYEKMDRKSLKYEFNKKRYSLFSLRGKDYFFDKFSFRGFPIDKDLHKLLENNDINKIESSTLDDLIHKNVII